VRKDWGFRIGDFGLIERNFSIFDFGPPASPERLAMAGGDCGLFEITSGILDCGLDTFDSQRIQLIF